MEGIENKLYNWVNEKYRLVQETASLLRQLRDNPGSNNLIRRISNRDIRLKVLDNRINRLGGRYNIVKAKGYYMLKAGEFLIPKEFEVYFTDITESDALIKVNLMFPDGTDKVSTTIIPVNQALVNKFK